MISNNNIAIQVAYKIIDRKTDQPIRKENVHLIESLKPRLFQPERHNYSDDYYTIPADVCVSSIVKKEIITIYDYISDNKQSKLKQVIVDKVTVPYEMIYYVEFSNGVRCDTHQDTELCVKTTDNKYTLMKIKDISEGATVQTLTGLGVKLLRKISRKDMSSQKTLYRILDLPDNYCYAITTCMDQHDYILMKDV